MLHFPYEVFNQKNAHNTAPCPNNLLWSVNPKYSFKIAYFLLLSLFDGTGNRRCLFIWRIRSTWSIFTTTQILRQSSYNWAIWVENVLPLRMSDDVLYRWGCRPWDVSRSGWASELVSSNTSTTLYRNEYTFMVSQSVESRGFCLILHHLFCTEAILVHARSLLSLRPVGWYSSFCTVVLLNWIIYYGNHLMIEMIQRLSGFLTIKMIIR